MAELCHVCDLFRVALFGEVLPFSCFTRKLSSVALSGTMCLLGFVTLPKVTALPVA